MAQPKKAKKQLSESEKEAHKVALKSESKADKFRRLAKKRVPKAIKALSSIENLANYEYTNDQAAKVLEALGGALNRVSIAFSTEKAVSVVEFEI